MKGLLISLLTFVLYGLTAAVVAHVTRPKAYLKMFVLTTIVWAPGYFLLYFLTPANLGCLPIAWQCSNREFDVGYGFVVFLFNCHTFVDCFFGFCTGFSVSLLVAILKAHGRLSYDELVARFALEDGADRIYTWRLPYLQKIGWLNRDPVSGDYRLTGKGRILALIIFSLKRTMNLGKGG